MKNIHVGLILDGNRRWAKQRLWKPWKGHSKGFEKLKKLFDWILELEIKETSLYCFSIQNFGRPEIEKNHLFDIFRKEIDTLLNDERLEKDQIKIRFAGRINLFPEDMQEKMKELMEKTAEYDKHIINFAMAYGGREEIIDTVNKMVEAGEEITEKSLQENMWVPENLDIVIRTSGEHRTSNFFIWQASYAEIFFIDKHWPDFEKEDLVRILSEFEEKRERRFGK
ncbi:MAG: di-trans,poly-cis-decaprenylcistransferase [Parcubacteria group bacterium]|nr:di-trans,poly-cis-decaprenylcistransferase [Parcubacteria group bacterium]|tara:strand:+ start:3676 stop:4350 length:675 start_codon:yes stop_codon:yes gene_type:complete